MAQPQHINAMKQDFSSLLNLGASSPIAVLGLAAIVLFSVYRALWSRNAGNPPLPPGPPAEPVLGHYRIVPQDAAFRRYADWAKEYDTDVLFFHSFGTKWVVLNTLAAATELLDKRGSNYADRPRFVMFEEMGWSPTLTWLRWGPKYQLHRKVLQPPFVKSKVAQYTALQRREALRFCLGAIDHPEDWLTAVRRFSVSIVLKIAYGIEVEGRDSPWIKLAGDTAHAVGKSGAPASSIMDRIPATRYLPDWLPFMERLRYAHTWRPTIQNLTGLPFEATLKTRAAGTENNSFVHTRMGHWDANKAKGQVNDFSLEDIKGAAATIVIAGNDTTAASLMLLVLYLMQNPSVQHKAQAELDSLLNNKEENRLPTWSDLPNLPYTNLILQETYRMNPLSPLGIPHASVADDVYNGMFIPKGTIVYPNVWAMCHDERVYERPGRFWPERYLPEEEGGNGEPFPVGNFGFGRRICIGRALAENSLLIVLATMISTLRIEWPLDEEGKRTPFEPEWSFRGQAIVMPFKTSITARTTTARSLLAAELEALERHTEE